MYDALTARDLKATEPESQSNLDQGTISLSEAENRNRMAGYEMETGFFLAAKFIVNPHCCII